MASKYVRILCGVQLFYWDCHRYARTNIWPWSLSPFPYLAVSSRTQKSDLGGFDFDSSRILILRGGIFMSIHMCIYIYIYIFIDLHRYRYRYRYRNILRYRDQVCVCIYIYIYMYQLSNRGFPMNLESVRGHAWPCSYARLSYSRFRGLDFEQDILFKKQISKQNRNTYYLRHNENKTYYLRHMILRQLISSKTEIALTTSEDHLPI